MTVRNSKQDVKDGKGSERTIHILKDVTGCCLPGETTFIMGASGAGKTSLLNLLSDRISLKPGMEVKGRITMNDTYDMTGSMFGNYASYVMQDDVIFAYFTVKEALMFAGKLRLPLTDIQIEKRVDELILDLGLYECKDTVVGSVVKKLISGGERKRTAIGVELITDPRVVLLDEPTSGLDSHTTVKICKIL